MTKTFYKSKPIVGKTLADTRLKHYPSAKKDNFHSDSHPVILLFFDYCQHYLKYILLVCSFPCFASFQVLHKDNSFLSCFDRMHSETNFQEPQHSSNTKSSNINGECSHNHMLCARPNIRPAFTNRFHAIAIIALTQQHSS